MRVEARVDVHGDVRLIGADVHHEAATKRSNAGCVKEAYLKLYCPLVLSSLTAVHRDDYIIGPSKGIRTDGVLLVSLFNLHLGFNIHS